MIRTICVIVSLLSAPVLADTPDLSRHDLSALFEGPAEVHIATRYANGAPKVDGTFSRDKGGIRPQGVVQIWYPSGQLYQGYDPATKTLTTWYPGGTMQRVERAPLEPGGDYISTRYFTSGQMRERTVERFNDAKLKQRLQFYYAFEKQTEATPAHQLSRLRRSEHIQFQIKEGWHPNGQPHFVARFAPDAPLGERTVWTWYDPTGAELPTTRYFYRVNASSEGPSGWMKAGLHREYHDNGQLRSSIEYQNNRMHGRVQHFTDTGQMTLDGTYKRGELSGGTRSIWNADGQLLGWDDGTAGMTFHETGRLKSHSHRFGRGEILVVYDATGAITLENIRLPYSHARHLFRPHNPHSTPTAARYSGEMRNNRAFGRWSAVRADNSKVVDVGFDARGRLNGRARQWFADGQLAVDCGFEAGLMHGRVRTWYADGTPALEATMVKGQAIGPYATWHANGQPHEKQIRSATGRRILGLWTAEGEVRVLEIHDPVRDRHVTESRHRGVVVERKYRYPGRVTSDTDAYDVRGRLKTTTEYVDDDPNHRIASQYWPNGTRKSRMVFRDRHAIGVFEWWHDNGQLAKRGTSDAKGVQGTVQHWTADGAALPDTHFVDGIEQIAPKTQEPCFCNEAAERPRGLLTQASRYLALSALHAAQPDLKLEGYEETYLRSSGTYANLRGTLMSFGPLVAEVGGVRLVLNPCRHGTNLSGIDMWASVNGSDAQVNLSVKTLGVEFAALRSLGGGGAYRMTAEVGSLRRKSDGRLTVPRRVKSVCVPPAKVGKSDLVLRPSGGRLVLEWHDGQTRPALSVSGGRFEFTDTKGRVHVGQIETMRVTGQGMTAHLGGIDGPGGIAALAQALEAQGLGAHIAGAQIKVQTKARP